MVFDATNNNGKMIGAVELGALPDHLQQAKEMKPNSGEPSGAQRLFAMFAPLFQELDNLFLGSREVGRPLMPPNAAGEVSPQQTGAAGDSSKAQGDQSGGGVTLKVNESGDEQREAYKALSKSGSYRERLKSIGISGSRGIDADLAMEYADGDLSRSSLMKKLEKKYSSSD